VLTGLPNPSTDPALNINAAVDFAGVLEDGFKETIG
jgi:hypothetical protein